VTRPPVLREAILAALREHGSLTSNEIALHVFGDPKANAPGVRKAIWFMVDIGFITCDKSHPRRHVYSLSDDEPVRRTVRPADKFKLPTKLKRAGAMNPMAWSMRHLLGASC